MNPNFQQLMQQATQLTRAGRLADATVLIQRAVAANSAAAAPAPTTPASRALPEQIILEGCVFEVPQAKAASAPEAPKTPNAARLKPAQAPAGSHTHGGLTRQYTLYVPPQASAASKPLPLVVMLHGCTQNPADFALGTGMSLRAAEQGFYVLYPAQSQEANASGCWSWFKHTHQRRGSGEPALIASLVQAVVAAHCVDAGRVYIAGLSAGGAMAAIVAQLYPEIFAAVGVHSGLACGAANNLMQAMAAMKSGAPQSPAQLTAARLPATVPTIVFHGDSDATVHPGNGAQVIEAALHGRAHGAARIEQGASERGQRYTRTVYCSKQDSAPFAEHWALHGGTHAWAGGDARGSYTDPRGVDATGEMLRFFVAQSAPLRR